MIVPDYISFSSGGVVHVYSGGGSGIRYEMAFGGKVYVHSGGVFESATVRNGNSAVISSGALASKAECIFGGNLILSGGTAIDASVYDQGVLTISKGAVNSQARITYNGSAIVKPGGVTYDDALHGTMLVSSGGTAVTS